jgi:microcystin-dependent protein
MKKELLIFLVGALAATDLSANNGISANARMGSSLNAPTVYGASSVSSPVIGDMVYDQSAGGFFGYNQSGAWVLLSAPEAPPAGVIVSYGGATAPAGWLLCDGSSVSRSTYSALFAAIGTNFGTDGPTSFNLPDLRGRFVRGVDGAASRDPDKLTRSAMNAGGLTGNNVGSVQGNATSLPSVPFTTDSSGNHSHNTSAQNGAQAQFGGIIVRIQGTGTNNSATTTDGAHTHSTAGGGDSETRPINANLNFIIKI